MGEQLACLSGSCNHQIRNLEVPPLPACFLQASPENLKLWLPHTPDGALLLIAVGVCLVFLELNRPGWILPGAVGLALILLSTPALLPGPHPLWALTLLPATILVSALHLWRPIPLSASMGTVLAMILSLRFLVADSTAPHVHWPAAVGCGVVIGLLSTCLARIALHARLSKQFQARKQVN